jgi:hypothetical protein
MSEISMFQDYPVLATVSLILLGVILLYMARQQAHRGIGGVCRVAANALRLAARSVMLAEAKLRQRNREVLLAAGMQEVEKELEREFHRVEASVKRDLQTYPNFHRSMADLVTRIDEDYRQSTEVPPSPPAWISAVDAVASIPQGADAGVATILGEIHKTLERQHQAAMAEYRKASGVRHGLLKRMMPFWRQLSETLEKVGKTITGLQERSRIIDRKMAEYEETRAQSDLAERRLSSSSLTQFVVAGLVMLIAVGGAVINFNLIALPMSEMVGGGSYIGPYKTSNVAALVIILVELSMGLFLMESLRITRLFPVISQMDDRMRTRMIWVSFSILCILAGVESALAFMRDRIAADMEALRQTLAGTEAALGAGHSLIPTIGQMVMGFVLPFALTFVAIPLESFIQATRTLLGLALSWLLRVCAFVLRLLGNLIHYCGRFLVNLYDLVIFPPLWIEGLVQRNRQDGLPAVEGKEAL